MKYGIVPEVAYFLRNFFDVTHLSIDLPITAANLAEGFNIL